MRYLLGVLLGAVLVITLLRCGWSAGATQKRFEVIHEQLEGVSALRIIKDNETGAQYLYYKFGYGGSLTRM